MEKSKYLVKTNEIMYFEILNYSIEQCNNGKQTNPDWMGSDYQAIGIKEHIVFSQLNSYQKLYCH